jgi:glutathione peroxidase
MGDINMRTLTDLHARFGDHGLSILAFPCGQFANQQPDTAEAFCDWAASTYHANFDVFEKVHVKGPQQHPVFRFLATACGPVRWNYTKYLCDRAGKPLRMYEAAFPRDTFVDEVQRCLAI